jgi:hypothetical protein
MPEAVFVLIAVIGAAIHVRRHKDTDKPAFAIDTFLVWWFVVPLGIGGIFGAAFHLFDGPEIAREIGYTRGNGGFQFENAMGDLSLGVASVMCVRWRGWFWLAVLVISTIQYFGDAGGHIYYWIADDNTKSENIGAPLVLDIVGPTVGMILYALSWQRGGDARPGAVPAVRQPA